MNRVALVLLFLCASFAQTLPTPRPLPGDPEEDPKLPNGKTRRDLLIKEDYQKNLEEAARLAQLAADLKSDLEKGDKNIVSVRNIKQTEEIEKLARNIRSRLKRY